MDWISVIEHEELPSEVAIWEFFHVFVNSPRQLINFFANSLKKLTKLVVVQTNIHLFQVKVQEDSAVCNFNICINIHAKVSPSPHFTTQAWTFQGFKKTFWKHINNYNLHYVWNRQTLSHSGCRLCSTCKSFYQHNNLCWPSHTRANSWTS